MPAPAKGARLGGNPSHERHILANLATALFDHGRITTTHSRAKRLQPVAERLITFGKRGDLHARRRVMRTIGDKRIVHELFTEIAPTMAERNGGYTRITKVAPRKGDNAPMAVIELVTEPVSPKQATVREAEKATERAAAQAAPAEATEQEAAATPSADSGSASSASSPSADSASADSASSPSAASPAEAEKDASGN